MDISFYTHQTMQDLSSFQFSSSPNPASHAQSIEVRLYQFRVFCFFLYCFCFSFFKSPTKIFYDLRKQTWN